MIHVTPCWVRAVRAKNIFILLYRKDDSCHGQDTESKCWRVLFSPILTRHGEHECAFNVNSSPKLFFNETIVDSVLLCLTTEKAGDEKLLKII